MKELSLNILDLTQNSITAKSQNIKIEIAENTAEHTMHIRITDDGTGMSEETVKKVTDPFYTSRNTRKVGLGIPLFKMQAEMTGGSFSIGSKVGEGTITSALFKTDSIDAVPLGDIISTVCILISGAPEINFNFLHTIDDNKSDKNNKDIKDNKDIKSVELDTVQIKEVLGEDVSLAEPEVIEWIRGYLEESYESL